MNGGPGLRSRPGRLTGWRFGALSFGAGLLTALGQSPVSWPLVSLFGLWLAILLFTLSPDWRKSARTGWLFGTGYFAASLFWIVEPFLVDIQRDGWMAPFALVLMAAGLALFWAAAFALATGLGTQKTTRIIALVAFLGLAELVRSYALTGFPWGLLAYIWIETPLMQLDAIIGPHGLGMVTVVIAALPHFPGGQSRGILVASGVFLAAFGFGVLRENSGDPGQGAKVNLRLIQPNAPQARKWDPDYAPVFFRRQLKLSAAPADVPPDLVIWPEAAVTFALDRQPQLQKIIADAAGPNAQAIIGIRRLEGPRYYNSMAVLGHDGLSRLVYDKTRLVPFGEYIPFASILSRFGVYGLAAAQGGGFSSGTEAPLLDLGDLGQVLPLICYEAIFPELSRRARNRPDWILQITNDAWFGRVAGPQQHLAQARARAIEQGLPLVRVANTGISAVIDAKGRITASLGLGIEGKLDAPLPAPLDPTPYGKTGDWPVLALLLSMLLIPAGRRLRIF